MSQIDLLAGGQFQILNGSGLAQNLPGGSQQGPQMTDITVTMCSGIYSSWLITAAESNAFIITNAGSRNKAWARDEQEDVPVWGYSEKGTDFAIERTGSSQYIIKAVNEDLLWTVGPGGNVFLAPANGSTAQHFHFKVVKNADSD